MIVAFQDNLLAFERLRNLGFTYCGGADISDMMATIPHVAEGDCESWSAAWDKRGRRVCDRVKQYLDGGHLVSAREAFLRVSTSLWMVESYLHADPKDSSILTESRALKRHTQGRRVVWGSFRNECTSSPEGTGMPKYFYRWTAQAIHGPR